MATHSSLSSGSAAFPGRGRDAGIAIAPAVLAGFVSAASLLSAFPEPLFIGCFLAGMLGAGGLILLRVRLAAPAAAEEQIFLPDIGLLQAALETSGDAAAVTDRDGALVCANGRYAAWFGGYEGPLDLAGSDRALFEAAMRSAQQRQSGKSIDTFSTGGSRYRAVVARAGASPGHLLWTFSRDREVDLIRDATAALTGEAGQRLSQAGVMAVVADPEGMIIGANPAFLLRSGAEKQGASRSLMTLLRANQDGQFYFASESGSALLRIIQVPLSDIDEAPMLVLFLDETSDGAGVGRDESGNVDALLDMLPLGLAMANIDGRFIYLNKAFRRAAAPYGKEEPVYPGDLVVAEDKGAVSDLVRRLSRGPSTNSDIAVRLQAKPDEPVALTIAGVRGLGEAAVLLSIKDNSEEDRLKRQVAQATKMQAVGQLAGGVAHDFNNILTAIIGYCDLMLMRHTPGDSDYDDIQQIRSNSNRAAGLTRQLLAFSRQQTLRPQILQLPDVISEVSNLLKRLLGETVSLQVKHGRNLGAVRADPGQLEQVIVNLAVNARDAMPGGGTVTLHTFAVTADDVRRMATDILPVADYTALRVSDTGGGIPPHLLGKIFEPFFTTKEVGKGTGLGLSTVYGIVKQSGGFVFAESELQKGTSFTMYLPVHRAAAGKEAPAGRDRPANGELWGTETILLVEDETMVRAVAERALTRHGYRVLTAENGEAALEILAREDRVDLMISDVVMPTMDGPTTVREARKTRPELPILFISGYAEEQLRKSIDLERVAFLAKPFSVQKLAEAARDALGG